MGFFISNVLAYKFRPSWWELEKDRRKMILDELRETLKGVGGGGGKVLKAEIYSSLRYDCSIIFWLLLNKPEELPVARAKLEKILGRHASIKHGFLSVYEQKKEKGDEKREYFVAYPISKDPEWYLLDKVERSEIMAEHIKIATENPNNKGINSYTTMSFGIDDNEFVVLYELNSIEEWVLVTQSLREAKARKWMTNEKPILVGRKDNVEAFLA